MAGFSDHKDLAAAVALVSSMGPAFLGLEDNADSWVVAKTGGGLLGPVGVADGAVAVGEDESEYSEG